MVSIDFLDLLGIHYIKNAETSQLSSIKSGGRALAIAYPECEEALLALLRELEARKIRYKIIGNFTNTAFFDYCGVIISTKRLSDFQISKERVKAAAGASFPRLAAALSRENYAFPRGLYSIPGSVGGMVRSNAGAFGSEIAEAFISARVFSPQNGRIYDMKPRDMEFRYRYSCLAEGSLVLLDAVFSLEREKKELIEAAALSNMQKRKACQPSEPSLGSFFKRPNGNTEVWRLIDGVGMRGFSVGGAQISEKHAGFIINRGGALISDIETLAERIESAVLQKYAIRLDREAEIITE